MSITIECSNDHFDITIDHATLKFESKADEQLPIVDQLIVTSGNHRITINLQPLTLDILAARIKNLPQAIDPQYTNTDAEAVFRKPGYIILHLEDREVYNVRQKVSCDTLLRFLWYMKDETILARVLRSMSRRTVEMLQDDMQQKRYSHLDPDTCLLVDAKMGRQAVIEFMEIVRALIDQEELPDITD